MLMALLPGLLLQRQDGSVGSWHTADGVLSSTGGRPRRALAVPVGGGDQPHVNPKAHSISC